MNKEKKMDQTELLEKMKPSLRNKSASLKSNEEKTYNFNLEKTTDINVLKVKMNDKFDKVDKTLEGIKESIDGIKGSIDVLVLLSIPKESLPQEQKKKIENLYNKQILPNVINSLLNDMSNEAKNKDNIKRSINKTTQSKMDTLNKMKKRIDNKRENSKNWPRMALARPLPRPGHWKIGLKNKD